MATDLSTPGAEHTVLSRDGTPDGVVCFAAQDWWYHSRAHSEVQLMLRLAERTPVLLVNSIGMRMPVPGRTSQPLRRIGRKLGSFARGLSRPVAGLPNFYVMSPVTIPAVSRPTVRAANAASVRMQVARACRRIGIRNPALFVTIPTAWDVARSFPHRSLFFNRADRYSAFSEADGDVIAAYEEELLRHADRVLYVSHALMEQDADRVGERAYFLDHGVDLEHFTFRDDEPADLAPIPHPRIGFFGTLEDQTVDFGLLEQLARDLPHAQLVLVGHATVGPGELAALPNVHWLGFRPYEEIPRYGSGFDVAIMPWLRNDWIEACNPIKLKEYLALGLPVVTTDFPEVHRYSSVVTIVDDPTRFSAAVAESLRTGGPGSSEAYRSAVAGDSWDEKTRVLAQLLGVAATP